MGEALFDLEQVLMSKKEILTPQEADILLSCKSKSLRDFTAGALAAGTAAWAATWKLSKPFRINLSAGAGAFCGLWMLSRSLYSCADQILTMDGSILQKELANIMVTKYQSDPSLMQLISKHFYSERIFDDSTSNNPKLRWRYRNFFSDNAVHGHRTHDRESNDKSQEHSHNDSNDKSLGWSENVTHSKRTNLETKRTFENADIMSEGDPLDCLFSYAPPVEDIHHSNSPNKPSGIHNRARRRSHRRRRMRNHDDLSNSESAAAI
ncbi:hypothetical protein AAZX31_11G006400 [Glycine max]|uniref:Uncharacterized protein n=3 Tax=Glycine subgen. Soja TaxID=1462606 RepID=C6THK0_SOYBN|nr:uncharacterized protein LOC100797227 [Glycine max]XP_028187370.1 uncharacterized protein LOC114373990 [Glycine soja]ACU21302.1 unknown [Glycine max]KAG4972767.1 hypothetical protein JHK87_029588 [Glycine soja]KAG5144385.1 hypothetical protein JHK84_029928 [Glycine max]KAH1156915.1 hypothetical protein GYH30_029629 [Glycine max]KAH1223142.1 hypothetical protein GmHk_11G030704 [Glycine max]|eukprot:NP_001239857.1 uncharacterized protein LOC100797227 [Glycine max]